MGEQHPQFSHLAGTDARKFRIRSRDSTMEFVVHAILS